MKVHLFGAGSSPGCSNFSLKRTAEGGEREFGARAAETLRKDFYVDDALRSVPTEKDVVELIQAVKEMCTKGGFKLKEFVSNSRKMMMSVPEERQSKGGDQGPRPGQCIPTYIHTCILGRTYFIERSIHLIEEH